MVGATGYTGAELVRLLSLHPQIDIAYVTSERSPGKRLADECPWLASDLVLIHPDDVPTDVDGVFLCQGNGYASLHAEPHVRAGARVVDLSADHRLLSPAEYERGYG
ncbi:MAG: N-acetyl-gamma-glutamyl-phosphate reductase, partial [Armatimonadota bacterium]